MNVPYKILSGLIQLKLTNTRPLFLDTETDGLYGKICLAQFYQVGDEYVQIIANPEPIALACLLKDFHIVMHNAHYDITTIQQQTDTRWAPENYDCTLLLARLAQPKEMEFDLESVITRIIGIDPYKEQHLDKKKLQKSNWSAPLLSNDQLLYAATDVYYMPQVYAAVVSAKETTSYQLDILTLKYCLDFQWNGMPIDHDKIAEHMEANNARIAEIALPINCNSWQQVRPYIGSENSDALGLAQLTSEGNTKAKDVNETRKLIKQNSFLKKYDNMYELVGKFKPYARSGRLTANDENKQQIPRKLKDCFGGEGYLIYADYAQLELRTIACITNCELMVKMFKEGVDVHSFTAEMIFGADWTKEHRQLTKTANFNFLYGGGVPVFLSILLLQAAVHMDEREGYSLRKKWRNLWVEIYQWQQKGINAWKKGKLWSTPLGRQYVGNMMTDQLNIQNQGAGAEVAKLALHRMYPKLQALPDTKLINFIHDSYIAYTMDFEEAKQAAQIIADAMQASWTEMSKLFKVTDLPMPVNVRVGKNWGDIENGIFDWEMNQ